MAKKNDAPDYNQLRIMWDHLKTKYDFKRDTVKARILWSDKGKKDFIVITDEKLNTMSLDMGLSGVKSSSPTNILPFFYSEYTDSYNPIREYFKSVANKNKTGSIDKLAATIKTASPELFAKYLKKWLVGSVANSMTDLGCQNHTCLTLTGYQGGGKTSWLENLCPRPLYPDYIFTGELDLSKKQDTVWKLAEYFIINIEEQIKGLNRADSNAMKGLITLPNIKGRRPYGRLESIGIRIANFVASTNDDDFLMEDSRRYLCFEVLAVLDYSHINMDDVWAEAFNIWLTGKFQYWISEADRAELKENNKRFLHVSQEQEYISQYFSIPNPEQKRSCTHIVPATVIRDFLKNETHNQQLKDKYIGSALKNLGYENKSHRFEWATHPIKAWCVHINKTTDSIFFNKYSVEESPF